MQPRSGFEEASGRLAGWLHTSTVFVISSSSGYRNRFANAAAAAVAKVLSNALFFAT